MAPPSNTNPLAWFERLSGAKLASGEPRAVSGVTSDSRRVERGGLFVAVPGFDSDGHAYIKDALAKGATALLVQEDHRSQWERFAEGAATVVSVPDTRRALAQAAAGFYGDPAMKLGMVGVTGTDGKTTTVHLIAHVLESAALPCGYLSSVSFKTASSPLPNDSHMTTLEAPDIQSKLADMVASGLRHAVIEASSHGLALHRVDECSFDVGVFTTLSRDHLDFHGTMEEYREAKGLLFRMLNEPHGKDVPKAGVLNADDPASEYYRMLTSAPIITYALDAGADVRAERIEPDGLTSRFRLRSPAGGGNVTLRLAGRYNVSNALAAVAVGVSQGLALGEILRGIESFPGVPGRMEEIDCGQPFRVVVDIASTRDALHRVLDVLRPVTEGKLIAVFGCAGERDSARREGMGRVAAELADFTVLTNEDPRREKPDAIIEEIAAAMRASGRSEGEDYACVEDRREAMRIAFEQARPGDTVLLAGKATEQSIIIGTMHHPWDERCVAGELLSEMTGKEART
jgi:UDP-N-acetylmuramoyl-L-alanyl-D-glutamate--2,6-diaminopimelate ligase